MSGDATRCPGCGGRQWTVVAPQDHAFALAKCAACGTCRIDAGAAPPESLYRDYYAGDGAERLSGPFNVIWRWLRQRKAALFLAHIPPGGRVCDIGCERGELLAVLKQAGCDVVGTQLSQQAADFARDTFGIFVFVGQLRDAPFDAGSFDTVLMINVLEHLPDPTAYLDDVARLLKPGGMFWVEVPNAASFTARIGGKRWLHHDPEHHLWSFTSAGLGQAVERAGFAVEERHTVRWEHGPIGCLQTWLNFLPGPRNVIFDIVRRGLSRRPAEFALQLAHTLLGAILLPFAVVVATAESLAGNGQILLVRLRRR